MGERAERNHAEQIERVHPGAEAAHEVVHLTRVKTFDGGPQASPHGHAVHVTFRPAASTEQVSAERIAIIRL